MVIKILIGNLKIPKLYDSICNKDFITTHIKIIGNFYILQINSGFNLKKLYSAILVIWHTQEIVNININEIYVFVIRKLNVFAELNRPFFNF